MSASRKVVVGVFVIGGFFLFALGLFWIGDRRLLFSESLQLQTRFSNLSGLKTGSKVLVSGMDAGEVLAIQVPPRPGEKFLVRFRVLSSFRPMLRADSAASIQVEGLVGSKVLQVDAGTEAAAEVRSGDNLPSREPLEIAAIIQQAVDMVKKVDNAVDDVQGRVVKTIDTIEDVGERARDLVAKVGGDVDEVFGTGKRVAKDVEAVVGGIRQGRGLVGKLLTDDQLAARAQNSSKQVEAAVTNLRRTSEDVRKIAADIESRRLGEQVQKTASNVREATAHLKDVLAAIKPAGDGERRGLIEDLRGTLANTEEATSDFAENMEALKRSWFFRGFFKKRGFYDLDALSLDEYRQGKVASGRPPVRAWLDAADLFVRSGADRESLSEAGRKKLDEAVVPYLQHAPNTLLIVEGYARTGTEQERFLLSRDRAGAVRRYLVERFGLKPNYLGAIPMGALASSDPSGKPGEGVALVFFPEKKK